MREIDIVIIGAGTAGLTARSQIARATDNYLVVDNGPLGTTCARVGCMPSKVLIQVANDFDRRAVFEEQGIFGGDNLKIDHEKVMKHVRKLRDRFVKGVMSGVDKWSETHFEKKHAKFIGKNILELDGEKIKFNKAIIATGSSPVLPEPWKKYKKYLLDTNELFEERTLPKKMAVIGLGVIGIELGQALHRLGVEVIGIGRGNIAGITDPELKEYTLKTFGEEMNLDQTGVEELSEKDGLLIIKTKNNTYQVEKALISIGRSPNIGGMGIENISDDLDSKGMPAFNKKTFSLKGADHIFIAGDVNGVAPILHESADEGSIVGLMAVSKESDCFQRRVPMGITFCSPNIAFVGKTYSELKKEGIPFEEGRVSFEGQGRSIVMLKEKGLLKVYACPKTKKILGSELFGPSGEHLAHLLAWAISADKTVGEILSFPFYHPVIEEGLRTALRDLMKKLVDKREPIELARCHEHPTNIC